MKRFRLLIIHIFRSITMHETLRLMFIHLVIISFFGFFKLQYSPGDKCVFLGEPCMGVRGKFYCLELFIGVIVTQNRSMPLWHP